MTAAENKAVFLSYASQDAAAVLRLAEALRAAGVEVWFDQNELVGGDAWDAKIRKQIRECALFVPVISEATQARGEGYFRLEWKLAVDRSHLMAHDQPFLLPVVIDDTADAAARVPPEFRAVQWTRLPGGDVPPAFVRRVRGLLGGRVAESRDTRAPSAPAEPPPTVRREYRRELLPLVALVAISAAVLVPWLGRRSESGAEAPAPATRQAAAALAVKPGEKSVAVLPFANLSTEKDFLAEGIHDDVIMNLQKIRDLKVISRTSVLGYHDAAARNLAKIADELGVATIVEGSVRRVANQVRVNAKLLDARTEASLWADTLTGEASDLFGLQASMAQKIAAALKATLTEGERILIERRPTKNPVAYELFLKARRLDEVLNNRSSRPEHEAVIAAYQRVLAEDPEFALVHSRLARVHGHMYWLGHLDPTPVRRALAESALREAVRIDPDAPETHYARGIVAYYCGMNFPGALAHYRKAEQGLPGDASLIAQIGFTHRRLTHWEDTRRSFERALELEPRYLYIGAELAVTLLDHRRFDAARTLAERFAAMYPEDGLLANTQARAAFAVTGDRTAFLAALQRAPRTGQDPSGLRAAYDRAMWAHDFAAAEGILADPRLGTVIDSVSIIEAPAALHRALVAFLQGKKEEAKTFAAAAVVEYARRPATPRQEPFVALDVAAAKAYAGSGDEALRSARAAIETTEKTDPYAGAFARLIAGRMLAAIGEKEEALRLLRRLMAGESRFTPNEIRLDPCWSRLGDDPRFEEILQAAKAL